MQEVFAAPLNTIVRVHHVAHLYTKQMQPKSEVEEQEVLQPKIEFMLWQAYPGKHSQPYIVYDEQSKINTATQDTCFAHLRRKEIEQILPKLPNDTIGAINKIAKTWDNQKNVEETLEQIFVKPTKRLRSPEYLRSKDWQSFVDNLPSFDLKKDGIDHRLALTRKVHLLEGPNMALNCHGLICTNPGTGKSTWYQQESVGILIDKASPNSFLGFAKSPREIFAGTVDQTRRNVGIDQLESQGALEIVRYLFQLLENGKAVVSSGAVRFPVTSSASFSFLANPVGYTLNPAKSFEGLIAHLSQNTAIGRRFGIILYANDIKVIENAPAPQTLERWNAAFDEFRAVEEYAQEEIQKIIYSPDVWTWLNRKDDEYARQCFYLLQDLFDDHVVSFLKELASPSAQRRTRAGGLYCAFIDHLNELALGSYKIEEILETAEVYLGEIVDLNIRSLSNIASKWGQEDSARKSAFFSGLPDWQQEIVSAIEQRKRAHPAELKFTLSEIRYTPKKEIYKGSFHEVCREFNRRKNISPYLSKIRTLFGFNIFKEGSDWIVQLEKLDPIPEIKFLGTYQTLDDFKKTVVEEQSAENNNGDHTQFGRFGNIGNSAEPSETRAGVLSSQNPVSKPSAETPNPSQNSTPKATENHTPTFPEQSEGKSKSIAQRSGNCDNNYHSQCGGSKCSCECHEEAKQFNERDRLETALAMFKRLERTTQPDGSKQPVQDKIFLTELAKTGKFDGQAAEKMLRTLYLSGQVQEVKPGHYRSV
jgi:hypothetical protein